MKIQFSQSYYQDTGENSILDAIAKTRYALENAYAGFDDATDPDLIDCYIYEVNSLLKRYRFLLHQAEVQNSAGTCFGYRFWSDFCHPCYAKRAVCNF